jgi:hypothetical protein
VFIKVRTLKIEIEILKEAGKSIEMFKIGNLNTPMLQFEFPRKKFFRESPEFFQ